jgi:hypothetical protein
MSDEEELRRMAAFLSSQIGDPPPGKPKWLTDLEESERRERLTSLFFGDEETITEATPEFGSVVIRRSETKYN